MRNHFSNCEPNNYKLTSLHKARLEYHAPLRTWQSTLSGSDAYGKCNILRLLLKYLSHSSESSPLQYLCISNWKNSSENIKFPQWLVESYRIWFHMKTILLVLSFPLFSHHSIHFFSTLNLIVNSVHNIPIHAWYKHADEDYVNRDPDSNQLPFEPFYWSYPTEGQYNNNYRTNKVLQKLWRKKLIYIMVGWLSLKQALTEGKISSGRVLNTKSSTYTTNMPHTSTPQMPLRPGSSGKRLE